MIDRDRSTRAAAQNNAEWCDIVCGTHGIPGRFDADAWVNPHRTPRYYPDAVTLDPTAVAGSILDRIDTTSSGCSIKDSFATLDLGPFGFKVLHEAEWIYREGRRARGAGARAIGWAAIETADELVEWEAAWDVDGDTDRLFLPALLRDPLVAVLAGRVNGSIVAGAIANRTGDDVVGLSNVFATDGDHDGAWSGCLAYLDTALPDRAIVGYESEDALSIALRRGFSSVGRLRIWLSET